MKKSTLFIGGLLTLGWLTMGKKKSKRPSSSLYIKDDDQLDADPGDKTIDPSDFPGHGYTFNF